MHPPLSGQANADIRQYKTDRDPREPLFAYGHCLAHFAVDPNLVYVTTHLAGQKTRFLPFNRGKFGGAGKLPTSLRRSLACTNAIENMMGTVRRVSRNVKRWRNAAMALCAGRRPAC
jgi:hypothetical protein